MKGDVELRDVADSDLPIFFEHQQDPDANRMAAFTSKDSADRDAFTEHWTRIRSDDTVTIRTILFAGQVAGHVAGFEQSGKREESMEQRLSIVTLGVRNLPAARVFYDTLGWQVASEDGASEIVCYNLNGMALALFPWDELAEDAQVPPAGEGFRGVSLAYNVRAREEVAQVLEAARKAGGRIVKTAQDVSWGGHSGYFADPDGHLWEVAWNPHSPLAADGRFQWGGAG